MLRSSMIAILRVDSTEDVAMEVGSLVSMRMVNSRTVEAKWWHLIIRSKVSIIILRDKPRVVTRAP